MSFMDRGKYAAEPTRSDLETENVELREENEELREKLLDMEREFKILFIWEQTLNSLGIDNWEGYDAALDLYHSSLKEANLED